MDVTEVMLPGVGVRYEFTAASGHQVGIVARRDGEFDVICFRRSDPDAADTLFTLDRQQAEALADILGAPRIVERFADLERGRSPGWRRRPSTSRRARASTDGRSVRRGCAPSPASRWSRW